VPAMPEAIDAAQGRIRKLAREALRAIPSDHEAERAVLGAVLLDHESLFRISHKLKPESFDLPRHQIVYTAFLALAEKHLAITVITLRDQLQEQGMLERVGGMAFLGQLMDVPTAAHVEAHAEIVRKKSLARSLIRHAVEFDRVVLQAAVPVVEHVEQRKAAGQVLVDHLGAPDLMRAALALGQQAGSVVDLAVHKHNGSDTGASLTRFGLDLRKGFQLGANIR